MRTQEEINVEYSKFAVLAGDRQFRIKALQEQISELSRELDAFNTKMKELHLEKPKAVEVKAVEEKKMESQVEDQVAPSESA